MEEYKKLATLIRYYILLASTTAGSGHPTSSLSAVELMTMLYFKYLQFDLENSQNPVNDRVIFSKGHASPLFYALYAAAGKISEAELLKYRTFESVLEGHPTPRFPFTEVPTGSLGQGLSVGVGMALAMRMKNPKSEIRNLKKMIPANTQTEKNLDVSNFPKVYILLGDGEMAEGSQWEAIQSAGYYQLSNLIGILDVNSLGQSGSTMLQHDLDTYAERISAFGWNTLTVEDGHDLEMVDKAFEETLEGSRQGSNNNSQPTMIIAKTLKGKGVSFIENKAGWHGKPLAKADFDNAIAELGQVDKQIIGKIQSPRHSGELGEHRTTPESERSSVNLPTDYKPLLNPPLLKGREGWGSDSIATRQAFGKALVKLGKLTDDVVVIDGDVKNSTYTEYFEKEYPDRFVQLFIAEQNMVGVATGMAKRGKKPYVATFSSFWPRAADQIRMAAYANVAIVFCGSHAGVSIGEDGPSQMGLEDLSLFRTLVNSTVLYPADGVSTEKLVGLSYAHPGITYIRTTRPATKILYTNETEFHIGGSHTYYSSSETKWSREVSKNKESSRLHSNNMQVITIVAAGITLYEALKVQELLEKDGIGVRVIDCYSIKPIDVKTLQKAAAETRAIITVEDHSRYGGLGDAVLEALAETPKVPIYNLAVTKTPRSGKPAELMDYEGISASAIMTQVKKILK